MIPGYELVFMQAMVRLLRWRQPDEVFLCGCVGRPRWRLQLRLPQPVRAAEGMTEWDVLFMPVDDLHPDERTVRSQLFLFFDQPPWVVEEHFRWLQDTMLLYIGKQPGVVFRAITPLGWRIHHEPVRTTESHHHGLR